MMGSGGSGTSGGATNIGGEKPIKATAPTRRTEADRFRDDAAQLIVRSQAPIGSRPTPSGGFRDLQNTMGLAEQSRRRREAERQGFTAEERRMRAPQRGLEPGEVLATIGSSGYGQIAAAKLAGRTDVSREQLGDLATRTNIGQLPAGRASVPGVGSVALNVLNVIGQRSAKTILDRIIEGDEPITNPSGRVVGARGESGTFSVAPPAAPSVSPTGRDAPQMSDITPEVTPEVTPERDDAPLATRGRTAFTRDRRRTRAARFGQAGLGEEGILLRGPSSSYGG